jgi:hypothetical protein
MLDKPVDKELMANFPEDWKPASHMDDPGLEGRI